MLSETLEFWSQLETIATVLAPDGAALVPQFWIRNGRQAGCHVTPEIFHHDDDDDLYPSEDDTDDDNKNHNDTHTHHHGRPCHNLCTHYGRYCAADPDGNLNEGLSGQDVVKESLRRLCIWKVLQEQHEREQQQQQQQQDYHSHHRNHATTSWSFPYSTWFAYVTEFTRTCYPTPDSTDKFGNEACIQHVYETVGLNGTAIDTCLYDDNALDEADEKDVPSPLLEHALHQAQQRGGISVVPTVQIPIPSQEPEPTVEEEDSTNKLPPQDKNRNKDTSKNTPSQDDKEDDHHQKNASHYHPPHHQEFHSLYGSQVTPHNLLQHLCHVLQQHSSHKNGGTAGRLPHVCQACLDCPHIMQCVESNGMTCPESIAPSQDKNHKIHKNKNRSNSWTGWSMVLLVALVAYALWTHYGHDADEYQYYDSYTHPSFSWSSWFGTTNTTTSRWDAPLQNWLLATPDDDDHQDEDQDDDEEAYYHHHHPYQRDHAEVPSTARHYHPSSSSSSSWLVVGRDTSNLLADPSHNATTTTSPPMVMAHTTNPTTPTSTNPIVLLSTIPEQQHRHLSGSSTPHALQRAVSSPLS